MIQHILVLMTLLSSYQNSKTVFEFNSACPIELWQVVEDVVMGGKSSGNLILTEEGNGLFNGGISIENNGGFSSIRLNLDSFKINKEKAIVLDVRGDGSEFQLRVKASIYDRHSFIYNFKTTGEWETISIPLNKMTASFRGFAVNLPNFNQKQFDQLGILRSSKKNTSFQLEIKRISLK